MANDPVLTRLAQAAIKIGTEGSITAGSDVVGNAGIELYDPKFTYPEEGGSDREPMSSSLDPVARIGGIRSALFSFGTDLIGSGTAGTAPPVLSDLIQACGFSVTPVALTSVTYALINSSIPCLDVFFHRDGTRKAMHSARGTFRMSATVGEVPKLEFELKGVRSGYKTDTALLGAITYPTVDPVAWIEVSPSILGETALDCTSFELDMNNTVALRKSDGAAGGYRSARVTKRGITVKIDPEERRLADFDAWGSLNTEGTVTWTLGTAAGNIITISSTKAQLVDVEPDQNRDDISVEGLTFLMPRGDATTVNPFTIVFT